jgi:cation:H+ antiporter
MFSFNFFSSLPVTLGVFLVSLFIVIRVSTEFTRRLEKLCEVFHLSIGMLSLLSALGANIPNYVSSTFAIVSGHDDVGIGIIIGSNIYNIAIILGLCTFFTPKRTGIILGKHERRDVGVIAGYAFVITLLASLVTFWLPGEPLLTTFQAASFAPALFLLTTLAVLGTFSALIIHILRRSRGDVGTTSHHSGQSHLNLGSIDAGTARQAPAAQFIEPDLRELRYNKVEILETVAIHSRVNVGVSLRHDKDERAKICWSMLRLIGEVIFTLVIALGGVLVMVQSGQTLTDDLHMPSVLAGLLVLAVATSLPNTVVAVNLVRTGKTAACVEEVCSSGSMNTVLGIVLPLVFWSNVLSDRYLLLLDTPVVVALAAGTFFGVLGGRIGRGIGILLLVTYAIWVSMRLLL